MVRTWAVPFALTFYLSTYTVPLVRGWGLPGVAGTFSAVLLMTAMLIPFWKLREWSRSDSFEDVMLANPWFVSACCTLSVLFTGVVFAFLDIEPPVGGVLPWTLGLAVVAAVSSYRYAVFSWGTALDRVLTVEDPEQAAFLIDVCRDELGSGYLSEEGTTVVELTLASALLASRERGAGPDPLLEALELLERAIWSATPDIAYLAAVRMVDGMRRKAERTGDDVGWDRALVLLGAAARQVADVRPEASGVVLAAQSARLEHQADQARDPEQAAQLRQDSIACLEDALDRTPAHLDEHAMLRISLARRLHDAAHPLRGNLNQAIRDCRRTARRLLWVDSDAWASARLVLADLLALRARIAPHGPLGAAIERYLPEGAARQQFRRVWPTRSGWDVARATLICMGVGFSGREEVGARARMPILREQLVSELHVPLPKAILHQTGWMYAKVVEEQMALSHTDAAVVAARWADWAVAREDHAQAAEAAWCWVTATASDLRRRVLHDKEDRLGEVQGSFAEAADLLVRGGRLADAALALDLGRAVVMTERMHRSRDGLEDRLRAAGECDLAQRWQAAEELIQGSDRALVSGVSPPDLSGMVSAEYLALADHEALLAEISRLPGFEDIDATPDFDDLRAAAVEGPVVYLAALERRGLALIVTDDASPQLIDLPLATATFVAALADRVPATNTGRETASVMHDVLPALWEAVIAPVAPKMSPGSLVTLIALGRLGELPLHMAGTVLDADGIWRDRTGGLVFRYAPNVRVLLRAQHTAAQVRSDDLRVLTVGVATSQEGLLPNAVSEARAVHALFAPRAERPDPPELAAVRRALDTCAVWHFACHGRYDAVSPLDSTLTLADGHLSVREILGRSAGRRRLAVLSACQTTAAAGPVPDEVVGFPSALMQAGVAGVISCQAEVDDLSAMFLVLAFFDRLREARSPAHALAAAQSWLRAATNEDLHLAFPDVHPLPRGDWFDPDEWRVARPCAEPSTWVLFTYTGA